MNTSEILVHAVEVKLELIILCHEQVDLVIVDTIFVKPVELRDNGLVELGDSFSLLDITLLQFADKDCLLTKILFN